MIPERLSGVNPVRNSSPAIAEILRIRFILHHSKFSPAKAGFRQIPHPSPDLPFEGEGTLQFPSLPFEREGTLQFPSLSGGGLGWGWG